MINTIEIMPHVFSDALAKHLNLMQKDRSLDVHELRRAILLFLTKHD